MRSNRRRLGMPCSVVVLAVLTAGSLLAEQQPTGTLNQNHVLLAAYNASALEGALNGASSMGLHVLFGSHDGVFLSRVEAQDPGAYRAIRENDSDRFERALNAAGEQSFRLIPATLTRSDSGTVAVVRRTPGTVTPFRYRVIPATDGLDKNMRGLALKGFSIVGVFTQQSGMAATVLGRPGRLYAVLEASGGASTSSATPPRSGQYRTVSALRASTVEKELNQAAGEGYYVVGGSFMNVLLEKRPDAPEHSYRVVGAIRGTTLNAEVEDASRAGFRVVTSAIMNNPNSQAETVIVMERMPSSSRRYEYRWVSASRLADSSVLDDFSTAGYTPIALWRVGVATVNEFGVREDLGRESYFILLEKRT